MPEPGVQAQVIESARQEVAASAVRDRERLLAVTRKIGGNPEPSYVDKVVKVREFKLPDKEVATDSIIVGPDRNLWFTEFRAVVRLTVNGRIRVTNLEIRDKRIQDCSRLVRMETFGQTPQRSVRLRERLLRELGIGYTGLLPTDNSRRFRYRYIPTFSQRDS